MMKKMIKMWINLVHYINNNELPKKINKKQGLFYKFFIFLVNSCILVIFLECLTKARFCIKCNVYFKSKTIAKNKFSRNRHTYRNKVNIEIKPAAPNTVLFSKEHFKNT